LGINAQLLPEWRSPTLMLDCFRTKLTPHPKNPRITERTDIIAQIADQIAARGSFDPAHAILVRPVGDVFQVISGHHRVAAAHKAGLDAVPCWVREMTDDDAFMALVLSNAQSELSALERGMHALQATEKGSKVGKSVAAYAKEVGRNERSVLNETWAAEVAQSAHVCGLSDLDKYPRHLAEIHAAPEIAWPSLVKALLDAVDEKGRPSPWTVKLTQAAVAKVKAIVVPAEWMTVFLPVEKVMEAAGRCAVQHRSQRHPWPAQDE